MMIEVTNVDEPGQVMLTVVGTGVTTGPLPVLLPQVDVELTATLSDDDLRAADGDAPYPSVPRGSGTGAAPEISGATDVYVHCHVASMTLATG